MAADGCCNVNEELTFVANVARTPQQLSQALRSQRNKPRLSQAEVGGKSGIKQDTVSTIEIHTPSTTVETLYKVLPVLGLELVIREKVSASGTGQEWLASRSARSLSLSMPLTESAACKGTVVERYFENLLPESGTIRRRIVQHVGAQILAAYGVPTARCAIAQFGSQKALVVERFDRRLSPDRAWIIRLPQEDFCHALGTKADTLPPHRVRLAMGLRGSKDLHYSWRRILPRHFEQTARRCGLRNDIGRMMEELVERTTHVIDTVQGLLPTEYGLLGSANRSANHERQ